MRVQVAVLSALLVAAPVVRGQSAPSPKREERIVVTQPTADANDDAKGRAAMQAMIAALGGTAWLHRGDSITKGRTSSFYQGKPTGVGEYIQFHHVLPNGDSEDRIELTKKRDVVQMWTATEGAEITYKGRVSLPKEVQTDYFRRARFSLDSLATKWLNDPTALILYGGTSVVDRREAESVTLINKDNESVQVDIDRNTHLPMRRILKYRDTTYKDFDEDIEDWSDYHEHGGVQVPTVTTRYLNGDMVSQRFVEAFEFKPVDAALFAAGAPLGKHSY